MKKKPVSKEEAQRRELLRQALDYVLPSGKAEAAVSTLLGRFGGFSGVFLAPQEELAAVLGQPPARFCGWSPTWPGPTWRTAARTWPGCTMRIPPLRCSGPSFWAALPRPCA